MTRLTRGRRFLRGQPARGMMQAGVHHDAHAPVDARRVDARCRCPYGARFESVGLKLPEQRVIDARADGEHAPPHANRPRAAHRDPRAARRAAPSENSLTLAIDAARDCLARSRYTGADLDIVIDASITRYVDGTTHRFEPPLSLLDQAGDRRAPARPASTSRTRAPAC